jgi:hypothetical protein
MFSAIGKPRLSERIKIDQAMNALKQRGVKNDYCSRCDKYDWNVDLIEVPANSALAATGLPTFPGGRTSGYLSLLAVVCRNCGNTIFHNLEVLGVQLR